MDPVGAAGVVLSVAKALVGLYLAMKENMATAYAVGLRLESVVLILGEAMGNRAMLESAGARTAVANLKDALEEADRVIKGIQASGRTVRFFKAHIFAGDLRKVDDELNRFIALFTAAGVVASSARMETLARAAHADATAGTAAIIARLGSATAGGGGKAPTLDELTRQLAVDQAASRAAAAPTPDAAGGGKRAGAGRGGYQRSGGRIAMSDLVITREIPSTSPDSRTTTFEAAYRDGSLVAVKLLNPGAGETEHANFLRETQLLQRLKLDHVVRIRGPVSEMMDGAPVTGMVMEFCYDDVEHVLLGTPRRAVTFAQQLEILRQAAIGVRNLHDEASKVTIHARLRAKRLLVNQHGEVVVAGLGGAKELDEAGSLDLMASSLGGAISSQAAPWTPPERFNAATAHRDIHTDVYGFGLIMYEVLSRTAPFAHLTAAEKAKGVLTYIARGGTVDTAPLAEVERVAGPLVAIMKRCLERDIAKRPRAIAEVLDVICATMAAAGVDVHRSPPDLLALVSEDTMVGVPAAYREVVLDEGLSVVPTLAGGASPVVHAPAAAGAGAAAGVATHGDGATAAGVRQGSAPHGGLHHAASFMTADTAALVAGAQLVDAAGEAIDNPAAAAAGPGGGGPAEGEDVKMLVHGRWVSFGRRAVFPPATGNSLLVVERRSSASPYAPAPTWPFAETVGRIEAGLRLPSGSLDTARAVDGPAAILLRLPITANVHTLQAEVANPAPEPWDVSSGAQHLTLGGLGQSGKEDVPVLVVKMAGRVDWDPHIRWNTERTLARDLEESNREYDGCASTWLRSCALVPVRDRAVVPMLRDACRDGVVLALDATRELVLHDVVTAFAPAPAPTPAPAPAAAAAAAGAAAPASPAPPAPKPATPAGGGGAGGAKPIVFAPRAPAATGGGGSGGPGIATLAGPRPTLRATPLTTSVPRTIREGGTVTGFGALLVSIPAAHMAQPDLRAAVNAFAGMDGRSVMPEKTVVYEEFNAAMVVLREVGHAQWLLNNVATVNLFPAVRGLHGEQLLTHVAAEVQVPLLLAGPAELRLDSGMQMGMAAQWKQAQITFRHGEYGEVVVLVPSFEAGAQILDHMREGGLVLQTGTVQSHYEVLSALPPVCFAGLPKSATVDTVTAAVDRAIGAALRGLHLPEPTESQAVRVMLLPDQASAAVFVRSRGAYDALTSAGSIEVSGVVSSMVPAVQFGIKLGPVDRGKVSERDLRQHPVWSDRTLLSLAELPDPTLPSHQVAYIAFLSSRLKHTALLANRDPAKAIRVGGTVVPVAAVVTAPAQAFDAVWYDRVRRMTTFAPDRGTQFMRWLPSVYLAARAEAMASSDMNWAFRVRQTAFLATEAAIATRRYFLATGHVRQITATAQASLMVDTPPDWPADVVAGLPAARPTAVSVEALDTIAAAAKLQREGAGSVLVVVDANQAVPGDLVQDGQVSAETDFAIRTNWLAAVDRGLNPSARAYAIPQYGVVYARGVSAIRGPESEGFPFLDAPVVMDCVGVWTSGDLVPEATGKLQVEDAISLARRIEVAIGIAVANRYDALVLPALGWYDGHQPAHVAAICREVLRCANGALKRVVFAVPPAGAAPRPRGGSFASPITPAAAAGGAGAVPTGAFGFGAGGGAGGGAGDAYTDYQAILSHADVLGPVAKAAPVNPPEQKAPCLDGGYCITTRAVDGAHMARLHHRPACPYGAECAVPRTDRTHRYLFGGHK